MGGKAKAGNFPALFLLVMQSAELHSAISRETTGLVYFIWERDPYLEGYKSTPINTNVSVWVNDSLKFLTRYNKNYSQK